MKIFSFVFVIALILSLVLSGCSAQREKPETEIPVSETEQWAKALLEAWSSHDFEKILSFYTSDCIFEDVVTSKVTNGREDLRAYFTEIFAGIPDFRIEIKSSFGSDDQVCIEWIMSGTHKGDLLGLPATGKRFSVPGVAVIEMENGKIKQEVDYFDGRQLGLLPPAMATDPL